MRQSEQVAALSRALTEAGATLKNPKASARANTGTYSYAYAPLDEIVDDVRVALALHDLACLQEALTDDGGRVGVVTRIVHKSGEWIEMGPLWMHAGGNPQQNGSSLTYARRYALTAALMLAADEDDDGVKASKTPPGLPPGGAGVGAGRRGGTTRPPDPGSSSGSGAAPGAVSDPGSTSASEGAEQPVEGGLDEGGTSLPGPAEGSPAPPVSGTKDEGEGANRLATDGPVTQAKAEAVSRDPSSAGDTREELRRLAGSAAKYRAWVNEASEGTPYSAATIMLATDEEIRAALEAHGQEELPA